MFKTKEDKQKKSKGTIEISLIERDIKGEPTKRVRSFESDNADEISKFWTDNKSIPRKKVADGNI